MQLNWNTNYVALRAELLIRKVLLILKLAVPWVSKEKVAVEHIKADHGMVFRQGQKAKKS